jgi:alpha-beta hydrolase superfamily lysophospholipase
MKLNLIALFLLLFVGVVHAQLPTNFEETTLVSPSDSLELSVLIAYPETEPTAIVQLVHGMCEHKERYIPLMRFLSQHGYVCVMHDHRGHGKSVRTADDLGYFYAGGYVAMVDDTHAVTQLIKNRYADLPVYLFGHSMGSMVVRAYTKRYEQQIAGLIVCGSPSYNSANSIGKQIAKCQGHKHGDHYRSKSIQKLAFGSYNKSFGNVSSPNAWICSDTAVVAAYDASPLCNYIFTSNGFYNLFALMDDAYNRKDWHVVNAQLPIWFISGEDDPCFISPKKFNHAVDNMRKVGYVNVTSKLYPHMRHEIVNELGKEQVWNDILNQLTNWQNNK